MKLLYLAGPIQGCTTGEAKGWRSRVIDELNAQTRGDIVGVNPLRCEPEAIGERYGASYDDPRFGTPSAIFAKNMYDVRRCDAVLAHFPYTEALLENGPIKRLWVNGASKYDLAQWPKHVSLGTVGEMGAAWALGKPVFLASRDPRVVTNAVVLGFSGWVLDSLDEAVEAVVGVLSDERVSRPTTGIQPPTRWGLNPWVPQP